MAKDDESRTLSMREIVRDASYLAELRRELEVLRSDDSREWSLNQEFYRGRQWVFWNKASNAIETVGVEEGEKPRYKVRITSNVILPSVQQLVAQMTKTKPTIRATPNSGGARDVKAAEMAERLYEYWWEELSLTNKLQSALTHAQLSQGYWLITWDALAGKSMKVMLNPEDGRPIWDDELADGFRDDIREIAEQIGLPFQELLPQFEQTVYVGDIRVQVLGGHQVWLDPSAATFEDCRYAVCKFPMTVDEVEARFGKKVTPDASTGDTRPSVVYTSKGKDERPKNVRDVYHLYHKPGPTMPKGKYVCWIEGPNEILYSSDWEYPFDELPLVKFPGMERPGSALDEARTTHARSIQKEINTTISGMAMHKNLTMKPQMLAPVGSLRQRLTDEPGAVYEYNPIQGLTPEWRQIPQLPPYVFEYLNEQQRRLDRIYNIMPTERQSLPARTDSGQLVELVQEAVADQISPEIRRMEVALAQAGDLMAALAQKFYAEPRLLKIKGPGGAVQVQKFMGADIAGGFSFNAEAGSGLPRTRAGQVAQMREMIEMGVLSPQEAMQYLPVAGLKGVQARLQADEDFAYRRILKLVEGEPVNVPAAEQMIQHLQTYGTDPQTGDIIDDEQVAIMLVEQAALQPLPHENPQTTMYVLGLHMKTPEFDNYPPDIQQRFYTHYSMLQSMLEGANAPSEPVKTTLSLKGTVGPTVAAEILNQNGIQSANPETMAEPPLETSVYDSIDKADADDAGNDPLTEEEKLMSLQQAAATHTLKMAKATKEMARADDLSEADDVERMVKLEREEEIHQERLRQMREKPQAKE